MKHLTLGFILNFLLKNCKYGLRITQVKFLDLLFESFFMSSTGSTIFMDSSTASRWFNERSRLNPNLVAYYLRPGNTEKLANDIDQNIIPFLHCPENIINDIYCILIQDSDIPNYLRAKYSTISSSDYAYFLSDIIIFFMTK